MSVFVDTSALYALLDRDDESHPAAAGAFPGLLAAGPLVTHSYVLVETTTLVQRRLGPGAIRGLLAGLVPVLDVVWVDAAVHAAAVSALLAAVRRKVSLVDWVSFEVMRRERLDAAFAFDRDFAEQGFRLVA